MSTSHEWDEQYLLSLIRNEVQENIHLDYKACDALNSKADAKKGELSKDVSAFANSDGGIIIYGMIEGKGDKKHLPEKLDTGFDPGNVSKEWIESVINSNIQRRISGIKIHPIELKTQNPGKFCYAIEIPQSHQAPHQASDKRYYKRFNFESRSMEEYEVRDVMNRQTGPNLSLSFDIRKLEDENINVLLCSINNTSTNPAPYCLINLFIDKNLFLEELPRSIDANYGINWRKNSEYKLTVNTQTITAIKYTFEIKPNLPIYGSNIYQFRLYNKHLGLRLSSDQLTNETEFYIAWEIETPNMLTRQGVERIHYSNDKAFYRFEKLTSEF